MVKEKNRIVTVIEPPRGLVQINLVELWQYRELLYIFTWRDIKVRYKQTVLGVAWAVFQPLLTMIIFTVFFGNLAKIPSDGIPYPVFVYSGLLFWNYYSNSLTAASNCMIENQNIINKVYFPRILLSIGATVTPVVDFIFSLLVYFVLMLLFGFWPSLLGIVVLPLLLFLAMVGATGLGLFLASVNVKYRDVRYILPFFIQILMFLTPVIYPVGLIPEPYRLLAYLNPMSGVIGTARALLLGVGVVDGPGLFISMLSAILCFFGGLIYFRRTERFFADVA